MTKAFTEIADTSDDSEIEAKTVKLRKSLKDLTKILIEGDKNSKKVDLWEKPELKNSKGLQTFIGMPKVPSNSLNDSLKIENRLKSIETSLKKLELDSYQTLNSLPKVEPKKVISSFTGEYEFLSNFYLVDINFSGATYPSVENAYQAAKTLNPVERKVFQEATTSPNQAKKLGRRLKLDPNWESIKDRIMSLLVYYKFRFNDRLKNRLLFTREATLMEGNWWNDTYWGVCNGVGRNHLGKILMKVRARLRDLEQISKKNE